MQLNKNLYNGSKTLHKNANKTYSMQIEKIEFCNVWHAIISLHVTFWAIYPCYTVCFLETITKLESKFLETTLDVKNCATRSVAFIIQDLDAVTALSTSWVILQYSALLMTVITAMWFHDVLLELNYWSHKESF